MCFGCFVLLFLPPHFLKENRLNEMLSLITFIIFPHAVLHDRLNKKVKARMMYQPKVTEKKNTIFTQQSMSHLQYIATPGTLVALIVQKLAAEFHPWNLFCC